MEVYGPFRWDKQEIRRGVTNVTPHVVHLPLMNSLKINIAFIFIYY